MNSDYTPGGGAGCGTWIAAIVITFLLLAAVAGGGDESNGNTSTTTNTTTTNVEALSRNQVNLWSDVTNEYYSCNAAGSCVSSVTTDASTQTTDASMTVAGDRNVIYSSTGVRLCVNPENPNQWGDVAAWCEAAGVQP